MDGADTISTLGRDESSADCVVVGAGIVGLCCAWKLREQGRDVLLLDRTGVAAQASRANAGACAYSDILPLARPGIVRQAPAWLLDPLGPLSIPPSYLPRIVPWLWRFWRSSRPSQVAASTRAQAALMALSAQAMPRLMQSVGAAGQLHTDGNLHLYESEAEWRASLPGWQMKADYGIAFEHLTDTRAIAAWQPGLSPALVAATYVPHWQRVDDPLQLCEQVAAALVRAGGRARRAGVAALEPAAEGVGVRLDDGRSVLARRVVIAAGAWSHRLARTLGERVPLETERGYNTTLPSGAFDLHRQLTFGAHGFVITRIGSGLRVGGAVELGGLDAPPNHRRAATMLEKAKRFLPGLRTEGGTPWMGLRPSLPDSLPVIGPSTREPRVLYAFGHGHLGLTQAAASAELVAALAAGSPPALDLKPFGPGRFGPATAR